MTACTNNGGSRARRAVTAALVGVLSVGAAPMVALATEAAPVAGDVQVMASADAVDAFNNGTVTIARDGNNAQLDPSAIEFEVDGTNRGITVAQVKLGNDKTITNGFEVTKYQEWNDANENGKVDAGELVGGTSTRVPNKKGTFVAFVEGTGDYAGGLIYLPFTIVNRSLQGAVIYDADSALGTADTTMNYTGDYQTFADGELGVVLPDGTVPVKGTDYNVETFDANGNKCQQGPLAAGSYTAVLTGIGTDYAGSSVKVPFTIEKLNLAAAEVTLDKGAAEQYSGSAIEPKLASIADYDGTLSDFVLVNPDVALDKGTYTYTLKVADGASDVTKASVEGEQTLTMDVVGKVVPASDFTYDGNQFTGSTFGAVSGVVSIDLSDEGHFVFDDDEVEVKGVDAENVIIEVVNAKTGEKGDVSSLSTPGDWRVTVRIDAEGTGYDFGGASDTVLFHVKNGDIKNATMYVTYDGETKDSFLESYTGDDFLGDIDIVVKDANGNVVPSSEYEIVVTKDGKEEVDSIVDHGTYVISVESGSYDVQADTSATFKVDPVKLSPANLYLEGKFADKDFLPYTGEVLNPGYKWLVSGNATDSTAVWKTLPTDVYTVTYEQDGKQVDLKEPGTYVAKVVISDAKGNFVATAFEKNGIKVSNATVFADVPSDAWYAEEVYVANQQGYIGGMGGTNLFAPLNDLTRADFACVLYRMAGGSITASQEDLTSQNEATLSRFTDVDRTAYYAKAIAWATELGITNGYGDTFGPERTITTEEFCAMLARYAAKAGTDTSVDADAVLATVADGDKVTGYARDAVAWAVESGYVAKDGNLIDPQGTIYRGRAVKIVVDYQPTKLDDGLATDPNVDPTK